MAPRVERIAGDQAVPAATQVVVIGGGIVGAGAALALAERGIPVVLCEKGHVAGEQSSRNWGWCRQQGRDPRELPLIVESLRLWRDMNRRVGAETGFRQCGVLYLEPSEAGLAAREKWLDHARPFQIDSRLLSAEELKPLVPGATAKYAGALFTASDGRAEPTLAAPALMAAARARGAVLLQDCAARGLELSGGRVSAVVTEKGRIACQSVILAGGAWSSLFLRNLGLRLPQLKTRSSVLRTGPLKGPEASANGKGWAYRKRLDGGYTIAHGDWTVPEIVPDSFRFFFDFLPLLRLERKAIKLRLSREFFREWGQRKRWSLDQTTPFEVIRTLDPAPLDWVLRDAMRRLIADYPLFAGAQIVERWAGMIDTTPDAVPMISTVEKLPGLTIATGFSGHGFGIGPAAGQLAADLATGAPPLVDPTPFRFSRFSDGTRPKPYTGL
jgi:glycine/D-amino acid oxidase-like deaminating enzyme